MLPDCAAYFDHLNKGVCCNAQSGRFCAEGRELWMRDKVAYISSINDRATRIAVMDTLRHNAPEWATEVEDRIIRQWRQHAKTDEN